MDLNKFEYQDWAHVVFIDTLNMDTYQKCIYNMCIQFYISIFGPIRFKH